MQLTPDSLTRLGVMPDPPAGFTSVVMAGKEVASGRLAAMLDQVWDIEEPGRTRIYLVIAGEGRVRRWADIEELLQRPDLSDEYSAADLRPALRADRT